MNMVLLFPDDFTGESEVRLTGRRLAHVLSVHRARPGDTLRVGVAGGRMGAGIVRAIDSRCLDMEIRLEHDPPPPLPLTLLLALPRPKVLRRLVQTVTTLGIKRIFLMRTWRVEKSYWQSPLLSPRSLREQMILGLEQACDTIFPAIETRMRFRPFIEDETPGLASGALALAAHPGAADPCPYRVDKAVVLAVGPEGGFIESELGSLRKAGFGIVSLGERVLRCEEVIGVLAGRLMQTI